MGFRKAREAVGLSVAEVCRELGVSDAAVYMWETGKTMPKPARLHEIAALYNTTVDALLDNNQQAPVQN